MCAFPVLSTKYTNNTGIRMKTMPKVYEQWWISLKTKFTNVCMGK